MEGKSELVGNVVTWAGVFLDLCLIFFDLQWGVLHEFVFSHFIPGFWKNCKNDGKRAPQVEGSQSLQIFLFQSLQTQQKCLKGSYLQIWQCRMEENCLQVFIRIHILMIFSFTWRNTGSLDIEQGLKVQNCGQTLLTYISLLNYVSLGLLVQIEYSTGSSCKVHL